jgi:hypothetical protein
MRPLSRREQVYLGIFVAALAWGLWNFRDRSASESGSAAADGARPAVAQNRPVPASLSADASPEGQVGARNTSSGSVAGERALPSWGPDPFHRGWRNTATFATVVKPRGKSSPLRLSAIVMRDRARMAVINGRVVGEGDTVEGRTVIRVEPSSVILDEKGTEVRLTL